MSDKRPETTHFGWIHDIDRNVGTMPCIMIGRTSKLPPLNKAYRFSAPLVADNDENVDQNKIFIEWVNGRTTLRLESVLSDERVVKAVQEFPGLKSRVINLLAPDCSGVQRYIILDPNAKLTEVDGEFRPFIEQIQRWRTFIEASFKPPSWFILRGAGITDEGYYSLEILPSALKMPNSQTDSGFDGFDPTLCTQHFTIEKSFVFWDLPAPIKMRVILRHTNSNRETAAAYGYSESYALYVKETETANAAWHAKEIERQTSNLALENARRARRKEMLEKLFS